MSAGGNTVDQYAFTLLLIAYNWTSRWKTWLGEYMNVPLVGALLQHGQCV